MDPYRTTVITMGLLDGKKIVVTGVLTDASLAFRVAQLAQREGAHIVLTGAGRALSLTQRTARKLDTPVDVFEFDVTNADHVESVRENVRASPEWPITRVVFNDVASGTFAAMLITPHGVGRATILKLP